MSLCIYDVTIGTNDDRLWFLEDLRDRYYSDENCGRIRYFHLEAYIKECFLRRALGPIQFYLQNKFIRLYGGRVIIFIDELDSEAIYLIVFCDDTLDVEMLVNEYFYYLGALFGVSLNFKLEGLIELSLRKYVYHVNRAIEKFYIVNENCYKPWEEKPLITESEY